MKEPGPDRRLRLCVVQLDGIPRAYTSRHKLWMPAEPLVVLRDPSKLGHSLPRLSAQRLFAADKQEVYNEVDKLSEAAAASHLKEILDFLRDYDVDVAVFPEYLTPISCLPELVGFSRRRAVVAGLEHVRGRSQAAYLAEKCGGQKKPEDLLQRNVSALVADGRIRLITKKQPSAAETIEPGTGPIVEEVSLRGRKVSLGVAVCMDYLRLEEEAREQEPEILCIPAYSPGLESFRPDAPRDYVRLFCNGAAYGGSQIMVPELHGVMTDELGVQPIRAGFEAVILIAYDRYPKRPTGLLGTNNQLLLRAEIIERNPANKVALNALVAYVAARDRPVAELQKLFTSCLSHISAEGPMGEIFEIYRDILAQGTEDARIDELACSHLTVEPGNRPTTVRRRQAEYIISQLQTLASGNKPIGEAKDAYSKLLPELPEVASNAGTLHATEHAAASPHSLASSAVTDDTIHSFINGRDDRPSRAGEVREGNQTRIPGISALPQGVEFHSRASLLIQQYENFGEAPSLPSRISEDSALRWRLKLTAWVQAAEKLLGEAISLAEDRDSKEYPSIELAQNIANAQTRLQWVSGQISQSKALPNNDLFISTSRCLIEDISKVVAFAVGP